MQQICRKTNSLDFFFQIQKRIVVHIHEIPNVHCPTDVDKAPRLSISIVIWILSSDTICRLNQFNTNDEAAMLSKDTILSVNIEQGAVFGIIRQHKKNWIFF